MEGAYRFAWPTLDEEERDSQFIGMDTEGRLPLGGVRGGDTGMCGSEAAGREVVGGERGLSARWVEIMAKKGPRRSLGEEKR